MRYVLLDDDDVADCWRRLGSLTWNSSRISRSESCCRLGFTWLTEQNDFMEKEGRNEGTPSDCEASSKKQSNSGLELVTLRT